MFVKGEHERQFAYEAHTACDKRGFVLGVEVTAGNVHDSVAWDKIYDNVTSKFDVQFMAMDAGYKTPWIAKKTIEDSKIPILPYTRYTGKKDCYKPWEYTYDPANDTYICPRGGILRHTTTDREGKRTYRSTPAQCRDCPCKAKCGANEKGQKLFTTHIWQEYLDIVEGIRKTDLGKRIYAQRKETIERVFADAKEKHAMRYTCLLYTSFPKNTNIMSTASVGRAVPKRRAWPGLWWATSRRRPSWTKSQNSPNIPSGPWCLLPTAA